MKLELDERVHQSRRDYYATWSEAQVVASFLLDLLDPWTDWHDAEHWAILERVKQIAEDRASI
jgi:hypothetical protein